MLSPLRHGDLPLGQASFRGFTLDTLSRNTMRVDENRVTFQVGQLQL